MVLRAFLISKYPEKTLLESAPSRGRIHGERRYTGGTSSRSDTHRSDFSLSDTRVFDHTDVLVVTERSTVANLGAALSEDARQSLESGAAPLEKQKLVAVYRSIANNLTRPVHFSLLPVPV